MRKHENCKSCRHWGDVNEPVYDADERSKIFRKCKNPGVINFQQKPSLDGVGVIIKSDPPFLGISLYPGQAKQHLLVHAKFCCRMYDKKQV
ncbi:MAG TPA: hypothetical protein VMW06_10835 [Desulfobacterales bacterium]|nr:hypothetical protein [Desulfobacterales bacterium]